jgi:lambda family phage portal protein
MGLFDFWRAKPSAAAPIAARYDAAQTNDKNVLHWSESDLLSASAANTRAVRQTLRRRARYESANSSYCRGIVLTLANDTIGCGPTLQLKTDNEDADDVIETAWERWCEEAGLEEKLRIIVQATAVDGEVFGLFITNKTLLHDVKLDIKLIEADQITTPVPKLQMTQPVDGIELDPRTQEPRYYHLLKNHPGDMFVQQILEFDRIPASQMVHMLNRDRPGQQRGIPEITAALPLFAQLRRFTGAVLESAEAAANIAGILKTTAPPEQAASLEPFYPVKLNRGSFIAIPEGWDMQQASSASPNATYQMFKHEIINEIARCLSMPFNVAACNSASYNYASGRLDHQVYNRSIRVKRSLIEHRVLAKIFAAWIEEAMLVPGIVPDSAGQPSDWTKTWAWDSGEHVDPLKEANALAIKLANNMTTFASEYAKMGRDWKVELRQRAAEQAFIEELGLNVPTQPQGNQPAEAADPGE